MSDSHYCLLPPTVKSTEIQYRDELSEMELAGLFHCPRCGRSYTNATDMLYGRDVGMCLLCDHVLSDSTILKRKT